MSRMTRYRDLPDRPWWKSLKALWKRFYWFFEGAYRTAQLQDVASVTRTDAEKAVDRILRETGIPPDCVGATVIRGGCAIWLTHTTDTGVPGGPLRYHTQQEAFVHLTYDQAATKALEWLEANDVTFGGQSGYNRESRRAYKAKKRRARVVTSKRPN